MINSMDSIGKYMLEIILHQHRTLKLLKQTKLMQIQEDHLNPIRALNVDSLKVDSLKVDSVVIQNPCSETEDSNSETASSKSVKESTFNSVTKDEFIDSQVTLDYDNQMTEKYFVEYTRIEVKHFRDTLLQHMGNVKKSGNDPDADDADIRPIYDKEQMAKVQLTAECSIFTIGQQHTEQPEIINEGRVDQYPDQHQVKSPMFDSSLNNSTNDYSKQSLESENSLLKQTVA
nr:hypothetical protein [Tanacetum cinerariifolium]